MITICMIALPATAVPAQSYVLAAVRSSARPTFSQPVGRRHDGGVTHQVTPGDVIDVTVGEVAHGGWCVARPATPATPATPAAPAVSGHLVLFVRHALPGELVRARVTSATAKFARADAIEVIRAAPERVSPPCPYARPGGCGGCDWQHASAAAQRELKARVIRQQLNRIAGIDREVTVAELPGDAGQPGDGGMLGWRTRVKFAVGKNGEAGLRKHRSHEIVAISECLIAHPLVREVGVTRQAWRGARWVDVAVAPATSQCAVMTDHDRRQGSRGVPGHRGIGGVPRPAEGPPRPAEGPPRPAQRHGFLIHRAVGRDWRVTADGFWQVHPSAADVLAEAVLSGLRPAPGEVALDLFCGAGLFAGVLADAVGPGGTVIGVERDAVAVRDARHNLRSTPWARVHRGDAGEVIARIGTQGASIAVADPPRTGLDRGLIEALCTPRDRCEPQGLRGIAYVSCDPATLARDIAVFGRYGWSLDDLRAFDAFPMTHHVECVAILRNGA
jgi:tRNA/tmRNA/rRNA uracil-C5-methylase (TrmA/RlmC/RlmD family)